MCVKHSVNMLTFTYSKIYKKVLFEVVVDGNEKCYRQRCYSDIGYINFDDKEIHIGCDESPEKLSYFCKKHNSFESSLSKIEKDER